MCRKSHQAPHPLFKYYVSKLGGGGSRLAVTILTQGRGGKNLVTLAVFFIVYINDLVNIFFNVNFNIHMKMNIHTESCRLNNLLLLMVEKSSLIHEI